ncbi:MAG: metallophosphoesterase [Candidatus Methylomirabilaceae bacterium]
MTLSIRFIVVRSIILSLLVGSQLYLYVKGDRALRRSRLSPRRKRQLRAALAGFFLSIVTLYLLVLFGAARLQHPSPLVLYGLLYPAAIWSFGTLFSFLILLFADLIGWCVLLFRPRSRRETPSPEEASDPSRRRFVQIGLSAVAAAPVLISGYGASWESAGQTIEEVRLVLSGARTFDPPLRVVQVSDIHSGLFMTPSRMRRCAEAVQRLQPDLFVLTGDYITNSISYLAPCVEAMAQVRARYGSFAVLGNHEHWYGEPEEFVAAFGAEGITVLQNDHRVIETDRGRIAVAGIDDLRVGRPDLERALAGLDPSLPTILLSHRPEIFPRAAARGIGLTLAGHYHGGQVKVELLGFTLSVARLLSPYTEGLYHLGGSRLYVNRGLGTTGTPVRINAPPEITLLHLV